MEAPQQLTECVSLPVPPKKKILYGLGEVHDVAALLARNN